MLFVPIGTCVVLANFGYLARTGTEAFYWFGPTILLGFVGSWLIWSIQVPKWRLWAYPKVESISELKQAAVDSQLIWPDGSLLGKTEIASRAVKQKIKQLEQESASGS